MIVFIKLQDRHHILVLEARLNFDFPPHPIGSLLPVAYPSLERNHLAGDSVLGPEDIGLPATAEGYGVKSIETFMVCHLSPSSSRPGGSHTGGDRGVCLFGRRALVHVLLSTLIFT